MQPLNLIFHLVNFALPSVFVAVLLTFTAPLIWRKWTLRYAKLKVMLMGALLGLAALCLGLWFYGVDGKISTYTVMIGLQALWLMWALRRK